MHGPLLVLGWPELSELEGCLGCRVLAEHGLRRVNRHVWVDTLVPEGVYAGPDVSPHGPGSGARHVLD